MDIDEIPNLPLKVIKNELVRDDFEPGEHEQMDETIRQIYLVTSPAAASYILNEIVEQLGNRCLTKYRNSDECETLLNNNPAIREMIADGAQNGFKNLRLLSKGLFESAGCMSYFCMIELLRRGECQSKTVRQKQC